MKPASEWDLNHILQLPNGEFDWVEFKGRKMLDFLVPGVAEGKVLEELAKQLSAFANSGGGVLVYGITNPSDQNPKAVDDGGVSISCKQPNIREWLEDVIPNLVEFPLTTFNVYALTDRSGAPGLANDRCVIVVDIPSSDGAPHQSTKEHRYFARVAGKSRPIGHRLVTDIFHRGRHPIFEVQMAFHSETWVPQSFPPIPKRSKPVRRLKLIVGAQNRGKVYAKHVKFTIWIPEEFVSRNDRDSESTTVLNGVRYCVEERDNRRRDVVGVEPMLGAKRYGASYLDPVLPSESRIWEFNCSNRIWPTDIKDQMLKWEILCDNAPPLTKEVAVKTIPFAVQDTHSVQEFDIDH